MLVLTLRTEKPEAEIGLYENNKKLDYLSWQAHRELSDTIHKNIAKLLNQNKLDFKDIKGLIIYKGPGSFTGLRIGFSVANALSDSLDIKIVATNEETWTQQGLDLLNSKQASKQVFPFYGSEANITPPRK
jgi:tRNA threonylcarbamoyladenosine biosynthesis protein TsaB